MKHQEITQHLLQAQSTVLSEVQKEIFSSILKDLPFDCQIKLFNHYSNNSLSIDKIIGDKLLKFLSVFSSLSAQEQQSFKKDFIIFSHSHPQSHDFFKNYIQGCTQSLLPIINMSVDDYRKISLNLQINHSILINDDLAKNLSQHKMLEIRDNLSSIEKIYSFENHLPNFIYSLAPQNIKDSFIQSLSGKNLSHYIYLYDQSNSNKIFIPEKHPNIEQFFHFVQQTQIINQKFPNTFPDYYSFNMSLYDKYIPLLGMEHINLKSSKQNSCVELYQHYHSLKSSFQDNLHNYFSLNHSIIKKENQPLNDFISFTHTYYDDLKNDSSCFTDKFIFFTAQLLPTRLEFDSTIEEKSFLLNESQLDHLKKFLLYKSCVVPPVELQPLSDILYQYLDNKTRCENVNSQFIEKNIALAKDLKILDSKGINISQEIKQFNRVIELIKSKEVYLKINSHDFSNLKWEHLNLSQKQDNIFKLIDNHVTKDIQFEISSKKIFNTSWKNISDIPKKYHTSFFHQMIAKKCEDFFHLDGSYKNNFKLMLNEFLNQMHYQPNELTSVFYLVFQGLEYPFQQKILKHLQNDIHDVLKKDLSLKYSEHSHFRHYFYISLDFFKDLKYIDFKNQLSFFNHTLHDKPKEFYESFMFFYQTCISPQKNDYFMQYLQECRYILKNDFENEFYKKISPFMNVLSESQENMMECIKGYFKHDHDFSNFEIHIHDFFLKHQKTILKIIENKFIDQNQINEFVVDKDFLLRISDNAMSYLHFIPDDDKLNILTTTEPNMRAYFENKFILEEMNIKESPKRKIKI